MAAMVMALAACSAPEAGPRGPAMMGGWGAGPGLLAGYGGAGMMGGYGMGPGMMGGYGMGPGMMGAVLPDLTAEQRTRIAAIQQEFRQKQWPLMEQVHRLAWNEGESFDEDAQRRHYDSLAALHRQMFENQLEARRRIDGVLTPAQRAQLRGR